MPGAAGDADHDTLLVASETAALDAAQATLVDRSTPLPLLAVARTLSQAVIPVLVREARRSAPVPGDAERDLLMRLLLRGDSDGAMLLGRQCVAAGMRVERLAEELLTPVARSLGSMWEEDSCDFVRVTYGMGILAEMMREMRLVDPPRPPRAGEVMPTILLANAPGEQHSFGIAVVADAFERAGWDVSRAETHDAAALMTQCAAQRYDVVGLSVAADRFLPRLPALIGALRRVARNPGMRIMVGGAALLRQPERASQLGADALAIDSTNAIAVAVAMVQTPPE
ncbi:MAG: cobalamin-dependent protein [Pseudomonadota bacterium]